MRENTSQRQGWLEGGVCISRVYKLNNKLVINIPFDVADPLGIKEGDDVDFFQYSGKSFLFAKKADVADLLVRLKGQGQPQQEKAPEVKEERAPEAKGAGDVSGMMDPGELALLKKLDTIRYGERTKTMVDGMLNPEERVTLQKLLKRGFVTLFRKSNESEYKYGIERSIYDRFLYGKRTYPGKQGAPARAPPAQAVAQRSPAEQRPWAHSQGGGNEYVSLLESKGYIVLKSEAEAASVSAAMEDSIRQGLVLGTRGFDKKFYIALRDFISRSVPKLFKCIEKKSVAISDIAKETGIDEDGARAVLNILAESGEVTEVRRRLSSDRRDIRNSVYF